MSIDPGFRPAKREFLVTPPARDRFPPRRRRRRCRFSLFHSFFPTARPSPGDQRSGFLPTLRSIRLALGIFLGQAVRVFLEFPARRVGRYPAAIPRSRSEEHTSELQS